MLCATPRARATRGWTLDARGTAQFSSSGGQTDLMLKHSKTTVQNRPTAFPVKLRAFFLVALCAGTLITRAEVPGAEKLLPDDTLVVLSVPDWQKAKSAYNEFPMSQLWHDPSMKAFTDKFG